MPFFVLTVRLTQKNVIILQFNPILILNKKAINIQINIEIEAKCVIAEIEDKSVYKIKKIYGINYKWIKKKYWYFTISTIAI